MFPIKMSDQGTGHESGAKVGTASVRPQDQMAGDVAGGVAKQTQMARVAKPKPPEPQRTMIGAFRVLMSGLKSLWDRPCPPHDQMVAKTSRTTTHNDQGHITFSFPSLSRSVGIIVLLSRSGPHSLLVWPWRKKRGARKKTRECQGPVRWILCIWYWI